MIPKIRQLQILTCMPLFLPVTPSSSNPQAWPRSRIGVGISATALIWWTFRATTRRSTGTALNPAGIAWQQLYAWTVGATYTSGCSRLPAEDQYLPAQKQLRCARVAGLGCRECFQLLERCVRYHIFRHSLGIVFRSMYRSCRQCLLQRNLRRERFDRSQAGTAPVELWRQRGLVPVVQRGVPQKPLRKIIPAREYARKTADANGPMLPQYYRYFLVLTLVLLVMASYSAVSRLPATSSPST